MCSPQAAMAGVQVAGSVSEYVGGRRLAALNTAALVDSFGDNMAGFAERGRQINQSAVDQMSERARQAMLEQGRLRAIGGDGAGGNSWDRLFMRSEAALGRDVASIEVNRSNMTRQNTLDARQARAGIQSQLNQIRRPTLLTLASGVTQAGASYVQMGGKVSPTIWKPKPS